MKEISPDAYLIEPAARQIPVRFRRYPLGGHATIQHQGFRHRLFCPVTPNHWSAVGQRWKRTGKAVQFLTQGAQLTPALGFRGFELRLRFCFLASRLITRYTDAGTFLRVMFMEPLWNHESVECKHHRFLTAFPAAYRDSALETPGRRPRHLPGSVASRFLRHFRGRGRDASSSEW
jgi:hypothetical protein